MLFFFRPFQSIVYHHCAQETRRPAAAPKLDAVAGAIAYFMASMGMDQHRAAAEQKVMETERLVEAFADALEGGPSLFRGRRLRIDDWSTVWNLATVQ
jgi:hypothetical protein